MRQHSELDAAGRIQFIVYMRKPLAGFVVATLVVIFSLSAWAGIRGGKGGKIKNAPEEEHTPIGSIRPKGKLRPTERLALAKISLETALAIAVKASPGKVAYAELEIDDGNLVFDFLIVASNQEVSDVQIDAGNGKVLDIDEGDDV